MTLFWNPGVCRYLTKFRQFMFPRCMSHVPEVRENVTPADEDSLLMYLCHQIINEFENLEKSLWNEHDFHDLSVRGDEDHPGWVWVDNVGCLFLYWAYRAYLTYWMECIIDSLNMKLKLRSKQTEWLCNRQITLNLENSYRNNTNCTLTNCSKW